MSYAVNLAAAAAEEARNEKGYPSEPSESGDAVWGIGYSEAVEAHQEIFNHLRSVIDQEDVQQLLATTTTNENLKIIFERLAQASTCEEREDALDEIIRLSAKIHEEISNTISVRQPSYILFRFEPTCVVQYRDMAYEKIALLQKEVHYIETELKKDNADTDELVRACARACRISRVAYVFAYTVSGSRSYDNLRSRFRDVQIDALAVTRAVHKNPALQLPRYAKVSGLLDEYSGSMLRRLQNLP